MRRRTEAKRNAILSVARQLFRKKGYQNTSMSEITEKVGGSKATIYGYFKSKKLLFEAVMKGASLDKSAAKRSADSPVPIVPMENYRQMILIMDELTNSTDDVETTLKRFSKSFVTTICQPEFLEIYRLAVEAAGRTEIGSLFYEGGPRHALSTMEAYLQNCMDQGKMPKSDAKLASHHFFGLIRSGGFEFLLFNPGKPMRNTEITEKVHYAVEIFLKAYGNPVAENQA